jgi:hypothetical protein
MSCFNFFRGSFPPLYYSFFDSDKVSTQSSRHYFPKSGMWPVTETLCFCKAFSPNGLCFWINPTHDQKQDAAFFLRYQHDIFQGPVRLYSCWNWALTPFRVQSHGQWQKRRLGSKTRISFRASDESLVAGERFTLPVPTLQQIPVGSKLLPGTIIHRDRTKDARVK